MQTAEFIGELGGKRNAGPFQNQKSGVGGTACAVVPPEKQALGEFELCWCVQCWDEVPQSGGILAFPEVLGWCFPAKPTLLGIRCSVFSSGVAAVHSDVIKINIIDCAYVLSGTL